jgi:hypothetical protein
MLHGMGPPSSIAKRVLLGTLLLPVLALAACSLLVDVDGLAGAGAAPDAEAKDTSVPGIDASSDGPQGLDAGDASADGGAVDSGCPGTFCEDFDTRPVGDGWDTTTVTAGAALDRGEGRPKPYALRARTTKAGPSATDPLGALTKKFPIGAKVSCSFGVFVVKLPDVSFSDLFAIRTEAAGIPVYELFFGTGASGGTLREDVQFKDGGCGCPRSDLKPKALPTNRWVQVLVDFDLKQQVTLRYDGEIISSGPMGGLTPVNNIFVSLGVQGRYADQTSEYLFDDLVCTVAP